MSESITDENEVSEMAQNIYDGLELTVRELQSKLPDQVDGLTTKQLRRVLKGVIQYPELNAENAASMTDREMKITASIMALRQAGVQLEIKAIGELQRAYDKKQQQQGEK